MLAIIGHDALQPFTCPSALPDSIAIAVRQNGTHQPSTGTEAGQHCCTQDVDTAVTAAALTAAPLHH
jgi:hypothetical protein